MLDTDPAVREFEKDPAKYMDKKASELRSGEFEQARARHSDANHEPQVSLLVRLKTLLSAKEKGQKKGG
ncbi:hypothetical protein ACFZAE_10770 [Streptomyces scabiei]|uniref:hypothetical protein n=1 Tax=Streptomyces scabiei TaxID=1930 RepID=UPI0036ED4CB6